MSFSNKSVLVTHHTLPEMAVPYPWLNHSVIKGIIAVSVIGNIAIFTMVCMSKTFRRPSNYLIANLCVASVCFMGVFTFYNLRTEGIFHLWEYDSTTCAVYGVFQRWPIPVLPFTIMAISLDRSKAARNPLDHASNQTILTQILAIWALGFLIVLPNSVIYQFDANSQSSYKCKKVPLGGSTTLQIIHAIIVLTSVYLIPTYILIKEFITLRSKMKFLTLSQVEQKKRFQHRLRLMQNSCIFMLMFIICWLPQGIFQFPFDLPSEITDGVNFIRALKKTRDYSRQVVMLNTCLNPILLLLLSFDVREYLASCSIV